LETDNAGITGDQVFAAYAGIVTKRHTVEPMDRTREALRDYFEAINALNRGYYPLIEGHSEPIEEDTQVICFPWAVTGIRSHPDRMITDGSVSMEKVGLGEVKTPWVAQQNAAIQFVSGLPYDDFPT
jgi:hypothetical protein